MGKQILPAFIGRQKSETLGLIEPLHYTGWHTATFLPLQQTIFTHWLNHVLQSAHCKTRARARLGSYKPPGSAATGQKRQRAAKNH
jgi:hypothetical protein